MKMTLLYLCTFFLAQTSVAMADDPGKPLAPEEYFDFWLGEWNLHWYQPDSSKSTGYNRVVKILDGRVVQENFVSHSQQQGIPLKGMSLSVYNGRTKKWHQAWADNQGSYLNFIGRLEGDKRIFSTSRSGPDGRLIMYRMVFTDINQDSFTWNWEASEDDGASWQLHWQIFYQRKR